MTGLLVAIGTANAQQTGSVRGTVTDATGEAVIGANVVVKGTTNGSVTDIDGNYTLSNVSAGATLVFSFIGYKEQEVAYKGQSTLNITLTEDQQMLDEVVVIGYGSLSKRELSSSIVQVNREQFMQGPVGDPMELISGKIAGLNVNTTAAANPNAGSSLQVRGAGSVSSGNDPLVVIDGVAGGNIRQLSSQDIESITVLKDAASSAIYGTRGANGVILVTTKKGTGSKGKPQVTYDSWFAVNLANAAPEVLSADEFRRALDRGTDYGASTNWYDQLMRSFSYDNNQYLSISNSSDTGYYTASFNYKKATGLDIRSEREEYSGRFAMEQRTLNNRLQLNGSISARRVNEEWGNDGMFDTALSMNPTMPLYNADGTYYQPNSPTGARNPVAELKEIDNNGQRLYALGSVEAKLNILQKDNMLLNTSLAYSLHYDDLKSNYYTPSTSGESFWGGYSGRASITYQKWYTHRVEWVTNYSLDINRHNLKAMAGYTYEESYSETANLSNSDFAYDEMKWHGIANGSYIKEGLASMYAGKTKSKLIGLFGRLNYNWNDLVMASASLRYEGSTKFGVNNKWGYFPAASVAWEMANMAFMETSKDVVTSLKPRLSYGVTGRSGFSPYVAMSTYMSRGSYLMDGQWVNGYIPTGGNENGRDLNANPDLAWEKLQSLNVGVDFVLWNRLRGSIDYFDRQSKDLLYNYNAPQPPFVHPGIIVNVGTITNAGMELSLDLDVFKHTPVQWTTAVNYSYGTTKLKKLSSGVYQAAYLDLYQKPGVGTNEYFFRVAEGGKIGQFYGYKYAGAEDGQMLVYNQDGEAIPVGQAKEVDKRHIGNGVPTSFFAWNNTLRYKNFDLNLSFRGAFGFEIFNMRAYGMGLKGSGSANVLRDAYLENDYIRTGGGVISSFFLEKGDYVKLENLTLGYNLNPKPNNYISNMRVFLTAKNLFTLTSYSGNDPSIVSVNGITPGVDSSSAYPTATQISLGVTLNFK